MKRTLPLVVFCLFSMAVTASKPPSIVPSTVSMETQGNHLLLAFERSIDLETTRKIEIYNDKGFRVFRGDAFSSKAVSGLDISRFSLGEYQVRITLFDQIIETSFKKE